MILIPDLFRARALPGGDPVLQFTDIKGVVNQYYRNGTNLREFSNVPGFKVNVVELEQDQVLHLRIFLDEEYINRILSNYSIGLWDDQGQRNGERAPIWVGANLGGHQGRNR